MVAKIVITVRFLRKLETTNVFYGCGQVYMAYNVSATNISQLNKNGNVLCFDKLTKLMFHLVRLILY